MSFAKQFSIELISQAARATQASAGASCFPRSLEPRHRHCSSIWASLLKPCSADPQDCRHGGQEVPSPLQELNMQLPPTVEPEVTAEITRGSMFVDTVGLTGLASGFFGDLDLFESCLQSFPRIPFHLAEA